MKQRTLLVICPKWKHGIAIRATPSRSHVFHVASFISFPVLSMFRETNAKPVMGFVVSAKSHKLVPLRSTCHLGFVGGGKVTWSAYGGQSFARESQLCKLNTRCVPNIGLGCVGFFN